MRTREQLIALYDRTIGKTAAVCLRRGCEKPADFEKALDEIKHVLAAKSDAAAGRYLNSCGWGEPCWCARVLRRSARIKADPPRRKVSR